MNLSNSFDYDYLKNHIKKNEKKFLDYRMKTTDNLIQEEDLEYNLNDESYTYFPPNAAKLSFDSETTPDGL